MSNRAGVLVAGLLTMASLAACTTTQPGQAEPAPGSESTVESPGQSSSSNPSPTVTIPPRPKELRLDGVDPCTLFTNAQLDQLKVNRKPKPDVDDGAFKGMRECFLDVENEQPFYHYNAIAITNQGIEPWLTGKRNVEARLSSVAGYPAATFWLRGASGRQSSGCDTAVDVAEGQQLKVFTNNDGKRSFTLEQLCQRAEQAAALAVQTLQTLR